MSLEEELRSLEERLLRPEVRADGEALRRLLSPEFVEFGSSGRVFAREETVAELAAETGWVPPRIEDFEVVAHTAVWALVTYRIMRPGLGGGVGRTTLRSSTWVRDAVGGWLMIFHQGTIVPVIEGV